MKVAVSLYVLAQTSLFVAWIAGLFNISVLIALIPTFVVAVLFTCVVLLLKYLEFAFDFDDDDDDFSEFLGIDDCINEEKEEGLNGTN